MRNLGTNLLVDGEAGETTHTCMGLLGAGEVRKLEKGFRGG